MARSLNRVRLIAAISVVTMFAGLSSVAVAGASPELATNTALTPDGVAVDAAGDVYVADRQNDVVDKITPHGDISVVVGIAGHPGRPTPGPATKSALSVPTGLAVDGAGDLFVADGGANQVVEKITKAGELSVVAGDPAAAGQGVKPGPATESPLLGVIGVALDEEGNLYIDDLLHAVVEKVTPGGELSIVAGRSGAFGPPEPTSFVLSARGYPEPFFEVTDEFLFLALAVTEAGGNLYVADTGSHIVEKVAPSGATELVAGDGVPGAPADGPAANSPLHEPTGLAVDHEGNLYIADPPNNVIEKVNTEGQLSIVAGNGVAGSPTPGPATSSDLDRPSSIAVDASGDLYIGDEGNNVVEKIEPDGELSLFAGTGAGLAPPTPAKKTVCEDEVLTGDYVNVTVVAGHGCVLKGAHVEKNLTAKGASELTIAASEIGGNATVQSTAATVTVSGSTIGRSLSIRKTSGAASVTGSTVKRDAKVQHNKGPVAFEDNHVSLNLLATNNSGPSGSTIVLGNTVGGKASCSSDPDLAVSCNAGGSAGKH